MRGETHGLFGAGALMLTLTTGGCQFPDLDFMGGKLIGITVSSALVEVGDTVRLSAHGQVDGLMGLLWYDPVRDARWAVADRSIAVLEPIPPPPPTDTTWTARTWARGRREGSTVVTATARGITGHASVRVIPVIAEIRMAGGSDTLVTGQQVPIAISAVSVAGRTVADVPFSFAPDTTGRLQMLSRDAAGVMLEARDTGVATISATFRRVTTTRSFIVVAK